MDLSSLVPLPPPQNYPPDFLERFPKNKERKISNVRFVSQFEDTNDPSDPPMQSVVISCSTVASWKPIINQIRDFYQTKEEMRLLCVPRDFDNVLVVKTNLLQQKELYQFVKNIVDNLSNSKSFHVSLPPKRRNNSNVPESVEITDETDEVVEF